MAYIGKVNVDGSTQLVGSTLYGTCSTAANVAAKVVTCADFNELITGVTIHVKFSYPNTATNPTLNVNNTGAKTISRYADTPPGTTPETSWKSVSVVSFTYGENKWIMNDHLDDTKTTIAWDSTNKKLTQTVDGTTSDVVTGSTILDGLTSSQVTTALGYTPPTADTNNAVTQTNTNTPVVDHRVLLSNSTDSTTETAGVYKNAFLAYRPARKALTVGTRDTFTYGTPSFVVGDTCSAIGDRSVAIGNHTITGSQNQLAIGVYNKVDDDDLYAFIVGNGDSTARSDAMTIAKGGSIWSAGNISADGNISANNISTTSVTSAEFNRLAGVTNNIQTQIDNKQAKITGAVSTVTDSNLTASMAMVTSATGKVDTSSVTATELNRLSGVTNNVQTQLDGKISPGNLNTYVFTRDFTVSAKTVTSKGAAAYTKSDSIPATGERLLGVVGYEVSGTNRTSASIYKTSVTQNSGFEVGIYNPGSADASWGLTVTCLYLKVSSS